MNRINRRRFVAVTSVAATSAILVACGNEPLSEEALSPTQIPDVPGAPPTLAPITSAGTDDSTPADTGDDTSTTAPSGEALVITMHDDFSFSPANPEVSPGQTVTVTNEGFMQHDLVSDDLGVGTALLNNGESEDIVIPEDAAVGETFYFRCTVAGHEQSGMHGEFSIVEAGAAAPAGDDEEAPAEEEGAEEEAPAEEGAAAPSGEALVITMHDNFSFEPSNPEVFPGQTITVTNEGFMQHDLVSDDLGIGTALLNNGESEDIVIPEDAAVGEQFHFICTVAGHEQSGMAGDFTIVEGSAAAAPAGDDEEAPAEEEGAEEEAPAEEGAAAPSGEALVITMHDNFSFEPSNPEVFPGQTITVVNEGFMQHDLVSDDLGIGTALLNNGESEDIVIPEDAAVGEQFHFICTVAGHEQSGMAGDFTIVEGSAAAAPAGDDEEAPAEDEATPEEAEDEVAEDPTAENTPQESTIVGTQWEFSPAEFEMAPGGVVTFQNNTEMMMGVETGEGESLLGSIGAGTTGEFTIPEDAEAGSTIEIRSNLTEAQNLGMVGTITIVAGDGAAASPVASPGATPESGGAGDVIVIEALDAFAFEPDVVEVAPGQTVRLVNMGFMQHDLVCDDLGIGTELLNNSQEEEIVIPDDAEVGESYTFICTVAGHEQSGMVGEFVIVAP